jgi:antitoxin component HigA of HigAB toxin-antitoxin module
VEGAVLSPLTPSPTTEPPAGEPPAGDPLDDFVSGLDATGLTFDQIQETGLGTEENVQIAYDLAQDLGLSAEEIDNLFGWPVGSTAGALDYYGLAPLGGGAAEPPAVEPPAGDGGLLDEPTAALHDFTSEQDSSGLEIATIGAEGLGSDENVNLVSALAQQYGLTADDLDSVFGWASGTTQAFLDENGMMIGDQVPTGGEEGFGEGETLPGYVLPGEEVDPLTGFLDAIGNAGLDLDAISAEGLGTTENVNAVSALAQQYGLTAEQLDEAFGWAPGTTQAFLDENGMMLGDQLPIGGAGEPPGVDPLADFTSALADAGLDIATISAEGAGSIENVNLISQFAAENGLTADQVDEVFGWPAGTTQAFLDENGIELGDQLPVGQPPPEEPPAVGGTEGFISALGAAGLSVGLLSSGGLGTTANVNTVSALAAEYGLSAAEVDSVFGWPAGTTQAFLDEYGMVIGDQLPAGFNLTGDEGPVLDLDGFTSALADAGLDIAQIGAEGLGSTENVNLISQLAAEYGLSASDIDDVFGWAAGTTQAFLDEYNLQIGQQLPSDYILGGGEPPPPPVDDGGITLGEAREYDWGTAKDDPFIQGLINAGMDIEDIHANGLGTQENVETAVALGQELGLTAAEIDALLGWPIGTSSAGLDYYGLTLGDAAHTFAELIEAEGYDIADIMENGFGSNQVASAFYEEAVKLGLSAAQIDTMMDWESGTVQEWIDANGLDLLPGDKTVADWADWEAFTPNAAMTSDFLTTLISEESPYLQAVQQNVMEDFNTRGLLNSSISIAAAQKAAIEAALPIAQANADALNAQYQAYLDSGLTQQEAEQAFRNDLALLGEQAGITEEEIRLQAELEAQAQQEAFYDTLDTMLAETELTEGTLAFQNELDAELVNLEGTINESLLRVEQGYDASLELAQNIAGIEAQLIQAIADINVSDMDLENKNAQILSLIDYSYQAANMLFDTYGGYLPALSTGYLIEEVNFAIEYQEGLYDSATFDQVEEETPSDIVERPPPYLLGENLAG